MKNSIILLASCLCLVMALGACGGNGGGYSCDDVCAKIGECEGTEAQSGCDEMCPLLKPVMRDVSYDALGDCVMGTDCEDDFDSDACLESAMMAAPADATDDFVEALCEKIIDCEEEGTVEECVEDVEDDMESLLMYLRFFKDSVLDCTTSCFDDVDCEDMGEDVLFDCMGDCDIPELFD